MATKVKGDAIKEGSIPLSALATEVKDKIENAGGGADWNAQEGAAGYIENKPFYDKGDIRQIDVNGEYEICVDGLNIGDRIDISWDLEYYNGEVFEVFRGSASFVIQAEHNHNTYYYKDDFGIFGREGEDGLSLILYAHNGADSHYGKVTVVVNGEIKTLDDKYLPNTILKTTPQTLSDDAKNQALANLGIDPVVLKYMCNPLILGEYILTIPLELRDIILGDYSEEFGYTLKPIASSLIKIYNGAGFTSIATFGNGQDYNIDFENNKFIINTHYEIVFV